MGLRIISGGAGGGAAGVTSIAANGGVARSGVLGIIGVGGVQIVDNGDGTFTFRSNLTFAGLGDVQLAGLADGQVPVWNAAAGKWENGNQVVVRSLLWEGSVVAVGGVATLDTGVLPATAKNLTIEWSAKGTGAVNLLTASTFLRMQINLLAGGHQVLMSGLDGAGASAITAGQGNANGAPIGFMPNGNSVYWGSGRLSIPDYNGVKFMQGVLSCAWSDWNGAAGSSRTRQGGFLCDAADGPLTRLVFSSDTGNLAQGTVISVYGDS